MKELLYFLEGKKTYIIAFAMCMASVFSLLVGEITATEFLDSQHLHLLLEGLGLGSLRAGVAKKQ